MSEERNYHTPILAGVELHIATLEAEKEALTETAVQLAEERDAARSALEISQAILRSRELELASMRENYKALCDAQERKDGEKCD